MNRLFDFEHRGKRLELSDETVVELAFDTDYYKSDALQVYRDDDLLIVGYLVHDDDCENPMTSCDGEGRLVHSQRDYDGYDPSEIDAELGWDRDNDRPNDVSQVYIDGVEHDLWRLACMRVAEDLESDKLAALEAFCGSDLVSLLADADGDVDLLFDSLANEISDRLEDPHYTDHEDEIREWMLKLYHEHWRQIVSPFVVEADYSPDRYSRTAWVSWFRGDAEDVKALWIGGENEQENITCGMPEFKDELELDEWLRRKSYDYAEGVIKVFNDWAEGDCHGCVVEAFRLIDGEWEQIDEEACWGFIGTDNAIESLTVDYVTPALQKPRERLAKYLANPDQQPLAF